MSSTIRQHREARARARFEHHLRRLELELAMGSPRRYLDPLVELLELLIERTGGNLYTAGYRQKLALAKARVLSQPKQALDHHLRVVQ
jgi:hypothetical protein